MICERCRAGQMVEYERKILAGGKEAVLTGRKCDRCGYTQLDSDDDIPELVAALVAAGVRLTRVEPLIPTLEELYFAVRRRPS